MTIHEPPAELVDKVTEQLLLLLDATGTINASDWAKKIIATCNGIVADDNFLTALSGKLTSTDQDNDGQMLPFPAPGLFNLVTRRLVADDGDYQWDGTAWIKVSDWPPSTPTYDNSQVPEDN